MEPDLEITKVPTGSFVGGKGEWRVNLQNTCPKQCVYEEIYSAEFGLGLI